MRLSIRNTISSGFAFILVDGAEYKWSIKDNTTYRFRKKRTHFYPLDNSPKTNIQGPKIEIERERKNGTRLEYNDFFPALFFLFKTRFLIPFSLDENI